MLRVAGCAVHREQEERRHRGIEQRLARDDDRVRHQCHEGRGDEPNAAAVQPVSQEVRERDGGEPERDRHQPGRHLAASEVERDAEQELDRQWVSPEDREQPAVHGVAGERRCLPDVHGLVAVEADLAQAPGAQDEAHDQDSAKHQCHRPSPLGDDGGARLGDDRPDRHRRRPERAARTDPLLVPVGPRAGSRSGITIPLRPSRRRCEFSGQRFGGWPRLRSPRTRRPGRPTISRGAQHGR